VTGRGLEAAARIRVPLAFLAMHVGWGIGFWEGLGRSALDAVRGTRV
jgi:hypothetical protein